MTDYNLTDMANMASGLELGVGEALERTACPQPPAQSGPTAIDSGAYADTCGGSVEDLSRKMPAGPIRVLAGAEGATAPETLRQKDRERMTLWKAAQPEGRAHRRA